MIPGTKRILLVEDDTNLGFLLLEYLEKNNYDVKLYRDGEAGYQGFCNGVFDICILDIMLPKLDGFGLAKKIKEKRKDIPVIFLTAKSLKEDKLKGFSLGIDDYITKPFDEEELLCRIQAVLMRTRSGAGPDKISFKLGAFTFDYQNQALVFGSEVKRLTMREGEILRMLCESKSALVKRDDILNRVWGRSDYFTGRSLDVFITKIRKYLAHDPAVKIESIPRSGFVLSDQ
jgi:two-component system, OmpR family, response regulator